MAVSIFPVEMHIVKKAGAVVVSLIKLRFWPAGSIARIKVMIEAGVRLSQLIVSRLGASIIQMEMSIAQQIEVTVVAEMIKT